MNFLPDIFLYNQDAPLLFTRMYFWGFLLINLAVWCAWSMMMGGGS